MYAHIHAHHGSTCSRFLTLACKPHNSMRIRKQSSDVCMAGIGARYSMHLTCQLATHVCAHSFSYASNTSIIGVCSCLQVVDLSRVINDVFEYHGVTDVSFSVSNTSTLVGYCQNLQSYKCCYAAAADHAPSPSLLPPCHANKAVVCP